MFATVARRVIQPRYPVLRIVPSHPAFVARTCTTAAGTEEAAQEPLVVPDLPTGRKLHVPGPVSTSPTVRQSMLHELGPRDEEMGNLIRDAREKTVAAHQFPDNYDCVIMPGSGEAALEAVISTVIPKSGKLLVIRNGADGNFIKEIANVHGIEVVDFTIEEDQQLDVEAVKEKLSSTDGITHLAMVHCDTSNGMLLAWDKLATMIQEIPKEKRPVIIADTRETYAGNDLSWAHSVDYVVTTSNRGLQGPPGVGFIVFNKDSVAQVDQSQRRLVSLDFISEWKSQSKEGNFRTTAPTHILSGVIKALVEFEGEGGWTKRFERYEDNRGLLVLGMISMGFKTFLRKDLRSNTITTFLHPTTPAWNWEKFQKHMLDRNFVISNGVVPGKDTFRIGSVGHLVRYDIVLLLDAVKAVKGKMKF